MSKGSKTSEGKPAVELWLTFADMLAFQEVLNSTQDEGAHKQFKAVSDLCTQKRLVVSWSFTDRDGTPLDPANRADYDKLHLQDYYRLRTHIIRVCSELPKD